MFGHYRDRPGRKVIELRQPIKLFRNEIVTECLRRFEILLILNMAFEKLKKYLNQNTVSSPKLSQVCWNPDPAMNYVK